MVKSITKLFEPEIQHCAELFKALSHPARIAILKFLAESRTCITGDISEELPLSRSTVNQHLAELKKMREDSNALFDQIEMLEDFKC